MCLKILKSYKISVPWINKKEGRVSKSGLYFGFREKINLP